MVGEVENKDISAFNEVAVKAKLGKSLDWVVTLEKKCHKITHRFGRYLTIDLNSLHFLAVYDSFLQLHTSTIRHNWKILYLNIRRIYEVIFATAHNGQS